MKDAYFSFRDAELASRILPPLSREQLAALPGVIRTIADNESYRESLRKAEFLSRFEEVEVGISTQSDRSQRNGAQHVERSWKAGDCGEGGEDRIESWLEGNHPVFMINGRQVNLEKVGLDGINGEPGFVQEFLLDTDETESFIDMICAKQKVLKEKPVPHARLKIAISSGGPSCLTCTKDLLERVDPELLEIFWIKPLRQKPMPWTPIQETQKKENETWIPGHVADVAFSPDGKIGSVKVIDSRGEKEQVIPCGLLVHTWSPMIDSQRKEKTYRKACQDITTLLDEKKPSNGLVRDRGIGPADHHKDLVSRMFFTWKVSIEDNDVLKKEIQELLQRKGKSAYTIVLTGKNLMTEAITALEESLDYDGKLYETQFPSADLTLEELWDDTVETKGCIWHDVDGQVVKEGTAFRHGKFSLAVRNSIDGTVHILSDLDGVINCAGKTPKTPLVEALKARGRKTDTSAKTHCSIPWIIYIPNVNCYLEIIVCLNRNLYCHH